MRTCDYVAQELVKKLEYFHYETEDDIIDMIPGILREAGFTGAGLRFVLNDDDFLGDVLDIVYDKLGVTND
jgi:hypothetical protein